ncbi:universal stress protein [Sphingomonas sp. LB-2]|uniref:universal stress protein n=1 Tax=Sphingomonas caeni TaxID=2984949 RepID=UPI0022319A67|nr:universal stress protein [Sphingomonas caeni]MCW3848187.1 universal stress protein [Sphingomonas caeni]
MIKDILAIVDNAEQAAPFIHAAVAFAHSRGAHLEIAALTPGPYLAPELLPFGVAYVPDDALARDDRQKVDAVTALVANADCPVSVFGLHDDIAWLAGDMRRSRQIADLILIGPPESWQTPWLRRRVIETSILSSGTPTLVVPPAAALVPVRRAVLGWKASPEANRAVHDLVSFAEPGAHIDVVMAVDVNREHAAKDGEELRRHLVRHGFDVGLHILPTDGMSEGDVVHAFAMRSRAELLAVGGFGHSRIREIVLGGVTRCLIADAVVPVMFSH